MKAELTLTSDFNPLTKKKVQWVMETDELPFCFRCNKTIEDGEYAWFCPKDKDFLCFDCGSEEPKFHPIDFIQRVKKHKDYFVRIELIKSDID